MTEWRSVGGMLLGVKEVELRSLRVPDDTGKPRRLRTCTVWKPLATEFTGTPASARLTKTPEGQIGVYVTGRNMGYVKIGRTFLIHSGIFVPFNYLSRKAARSLVKGEDFALEEINGMVVGVQR